MKRYKREEWYQFIDKWITSGLSSSEFCNQHDLSEKSFANYRSIYMPSKAASKESKGTLSLLPIKVSHGKVQTAEVKPTTIELISPQGWVVKCEADVCLKKLRSLLSVVSSC